MAGMRITIWDDHLDKSCAAKDRPFTISIPIENVVENETFTRRKAKAKTPFLPAYLVPVDGKTWAFGLGNLYRLEVIAQWTNLIQCIIPIFLWNGNIPKVVNTQNFHCRQIKDNMEACNRMGIAIFLWIIRIEAHMRCCA